MLYQSDRRHHRSRYIAGGDALHEDRRATKTRGRRSAALTRKTGGVQAIEYKKSQTFIASLEIRTKNLSPSMGGDSGWWSRGDDPEPEDSGT
jgi:hypothetical protein